MSRGFDRVEDVWQLKIVQLFGAVRIPRRSFAQFFFRFLFHFYSSILFPFFSILRRVLCVPAFGHTGIEPIVSKLAKSLWKNRALSNSTLSLARFDRFESKFLLFFLLLQFSSFFFFLLYELQFILFERNEIEKNFKCL